MRNQLNKFIIIILALLLTYVNIDAWRYADILISSPYKQENSNSSEYNFESKFDLFVIQRTKENISNVIENLYSFSYKKIQNLTNQKNQIFEQTLSSSTYQFVQFLVKIDLSCSIKQLIYPFDYFW